MLALRRLAYWVWHLQVTILPCERAFYVYKVFIAGATLGPEPLEIQHIDKIVLRV